MKARDTVVPTLFTLFWTGIVGTCDFVIASGLLEKIHRIPTDPDDTALGRAISGGDIFNLLFLTPFNLILLALWWMPVAALARRLHPAGADGVHRSPSGHVTRVRLTEHSPLGIALATIGITAFLTSAVLAFGFGGSPGLGVALGAVAITMTTGAITGFRHWLKQCAGVQDLLLNGIDQTVELPPTHGRKLRRILPVADVSDITVAPIQHRMRKGRIRETFAVTLHLGVSEEIVAEWSGEERARELAEWLRGRIIRKRRMETTDFTD